jgi:hypothetical protein
VVAQTKAARARLEARRLEAWTLYCKGWSQQRIAEHQGIPQQTVSLDLKAYRESTTPEERGEVRGRHLEQIRTMQEELFELAEKRPAPVTAGKDGDIVRDPETGEPVWDYALRLAAFDRILKTQDRESKLLGLDAPTQSESTVNATVTARPAELEKLIEQARAKVAATEAELAD